MYDRVYWEHTTGGSDVAPLRKRLEPLPEHRWTDDAYCRREGQLSRVSACAQHRYALHKVSDHEFRCISWQWRAKMDCFKTLIVIFVFIRNISAQDDFEIGMYDLKSLRAFFIYL
jgi:hypothetical protein